MARVLKQAYLRDGAEPAIAISITHDIAEDVARYISQNRLPAGTLLALGPQGRPGNNAVTSAGWATAWARSAREQARRAAADAGATHAQLYMAAPAALAQMLGHQWNLMPPTTIYEHLRTGYAPTFTLP